MTDELRVEWRAPVGPGDVETLRALTTTFEAAHGHAAVGDATWRDLARPGDRSGLLVASLDGDVVAAVHLGPAENEPARLTASSVVAPDLDPELADAAADVLAEATVARARDLGVERVQLWVLGAGDRDGAPMARAGFAVDRELRQLRVPLPLDEEPRWPSGTTVRPFRPGDDDEAWVVANNRAFADDPDQHGWTLETLRGRMAEPWFDPEGLLLAVDDAGIAGSCWTRLHPAAPPHEPVPLGEIYVIGVDPDRQGRGLGRALVLAGLAALHRRGAAVGMLFVDAANAGAVHLYDELGFRVTRTDRAYGADPRDTP